MLRYRYVEVFNSWIKFEALKFPFFSFCPIFHFLVLPILPHIFFYLFIEIVNFTNRKVIFHHFLAF